jgi:hypothetical protein
MSISTTDRKAASHLKKQGAPDDTVLAHVNPREMKLLDQLSVGGGELNPRTGIPQFSDFSQEEAEAALDQEDADFGSNFAADFFGELNEGGMDTFADIVSQSFNSLTDARGGEAAAKQQAAMDLASPFSGSAGTAEAFGLLGFPGVVAQNEYNFNKELAEEREQTGGYNLANHLGEYGKVGGAVDPAGAYFTNPNGAPQTLAQIGISEGLGKLAGLVTPAALGHAMTFYGGIKGFKDALSTANDQGISLLAAAMQNRGIDDFKGIDNLFKEQMYGIPNPKGSTFTQALGNYNFRDAAQIGGKNITDVGQDIGNFLGTNVRGGVGPETSPGGSPIAVTTEPLADVESNPALEFENELISPETRAAQIQRGVTAFGNASKDINEIDQYHKNQQALDNYNNPLSIESLIQSNGTGVNALTQQDLNAVPQGSSPVSINGAVGYNPEDISMFTTPALEPTFDESLIDAQDAGTTFYNSPPGSDDTSSFTFDPEDPASGNLLQGSLVDGDGGLAPPTNTPFNDDFTPADAQALQQRFQDFFASQRFNDLVGGGQGSEASLINELLTIQNSPTATEARPVLPGSFGEQLDDFNLNGPQEQAPRQPNTLLDDFNALRAGEREATFNDGDEQSLRLEDARTNRILTNNARFGKPTRDNAPALSNLALRDAFQRSVNQGSTTSFDNFVNQFASGAGADSAGSQTGNFENEDVDIVANIRQFNAEAQAREQARLDKILNIGAARSAFDNATTGFNDLIEERGFTGQGFGTAGRTTLLDILRDFQPGAGQVDRFNSLLNEDTGRGFAEQALTDTQNRFIDFGTSQINNAFPEGGFDIDQSIIDSIVDERIGAGSNIIAGQQARGNFNEAGLASANEQLQSQRPRINDAVFGLAESFVPQINRQTEDIRGRATEANQGFQLGDDLFDISSFTDERNDFLGDQNSGFRDQIQGAIGSDPLFDISDSLAAGRKSQGVVSGPAQGSLLDTLAARENAGTGASNRSQRGVGRSGSGAF